MQIPRFRTWALCALISATICAAQTPVSFSSITTTSGDTPANIYPVDVNNDGFTDLIQDSGQSPSGFTVSIANGNGTFKAPVFYSIPGGKSVVMPIATADFNNDGKVDVAVSIVGTSQIAVYLGNGDGTFQAPILSTINLYSGYAFAMAGIAAADFNADGNIDLVAWANEGTTQTLLYTLQGQGNGTFITTPTLAITGPPVQPQMQTFVGDYDSDGKADIAVTTSIEASNGSVASTTLHVLYGNNNFYFADTTPYTANGGFWIGSGDLNSDGYTDLFGESPSQQLGLFYGNSSRTFSSFFYDMPNTGSTGLSSDGWQFMPQFTMADFNGDGSMDLAITAWSTDYRQSYIEFLLADGGLGSFTSQVVALPNTYTSATPTVAGLFGRGLLAPDVALSQSPNGGSPPQNTPSFIAAEINQDTGWFGPCAYPGGGQGFNVCSPGTPYQSTTLLSASVASFGKLRKIELWVDGVKVSEQRHVWDQHGYFDWNGTFSTGTHQATFYAADIDNRLQRYDFSFTVGTANNHGCAAPSQPGIHICSPGNYTTVNSPVQALATANISGYGALARMEIWVDGAKVYTETSSLTESDTLNLAPGTHKIDFYVASASGMLWENSSNVTVP